MNTLHRSISKSRSHHEQFGRAMRTFSKRKHHVRSRSYKNDRANQRRIFLKSFKLETAESLQRRRKSKSRQVKKFATEVAKAVVSVMSFLGFRSCRFGSSDCRLAVGASNPTRLGAWDKSTFIFQICLCIYELWITLFVFKFMEVPTV